MVYLLHLVYIYLFNLNTVTLIELFHSKPISKNHLSFLMVLIYIKKTFIP